MTIQGDEAIDVFDLVGSFPRPAWVVLDAARDRRFTGELVFAGEPPIAVYFDRGVIYLAERSDEPSLGARLVDAGALNAAQLEHGAVRVGDSEHLGRLFERTPSVDRQFVQIVTELMNETCVADLARRNVDGVEVHPYRHHHSGVHHWTGEARTSDLHPGDPLPAPSATDRPVEIAPPGSVFDDVSNDTDALVQWDQPSWLDERMPDDDAPGRRAPEVPPGASGETPSTSDEGATSSVLDTDWSDRLDSHGLPTPEDDPLAAPTPLPPVAAAPIDRFELIWPSGQVDDEFGAASVVHDEGDHDRVGPTARLSRVDSVAPGASDHAPRDDRDDLDDLDDEVLPRREPADDGRVRETTLAVRRAVATVDVGSLHARRRLLDLPTAVDAPLTTPSVWSPAGGPSVFDDFDREPSRPERVAAPATAPADESDEPERVSALRRLIDGLRGR